jgi:hypothetical protein
VAKTLKDVKQKLSLSKLEGETELLSEDMDLSQLAFRSRLPAFRFEEAVVSGEVSRTIEGASTVTIVVNDKDGIIKRSGRIADGVDIKIDGLWFTLVQARKQGVDLTLTFESREVNVLRTYNKKRASNWGQLTRTRFAQILVNEVREFKIPFVCPELRKTPFDKKKAKEHKAADRDPGFVNWNTAIARARANGKPITIKGKPPVSEQINNAEEVLDAGAARLVRRKILVCAIMTCIQEATLYNHPFGDRDSVGLFQQRTSWGPLKDRMNPTKAANKFYDKAIAVDRAQPKLDYSELCQAVQVSAFPRAYAQWRVEAERIVTAYGIAGGDASTPADTANANLMGQWEMDADADKTQFSRGRPKSLPGGKKGWEKEDSWTCLQRLADEVNWRCFEVSGKVYFISEPRLFKSSPRMVISENSEGVDWIDGEVDLMKNNAQIEVTARLSRWQAPPGAVIEVFDSGVLNGRWLITEIRRSFFDPLATITAKKPRPKLPEPKREDIGGLWDNRYEQPDKYVPSPGYDPTPPGQRPTGNALRNAVLNHKNISFTRASQRTDISMGQVNTKLLQFMLEFMEAGFPIKVTSMRSDHSKRTTRGGISAHTVGKAVDMGNYTKGNVAATTNAMNWIITHQVQLGWYQLIGPVDHLCRPVGWYDSGVLAEHDDHIHVGFRMTDAEKAG